MVWRQRMMILTIEQVFSAGYDCMLLLLLLDLDSGEKSVAQRLELLIEELKAEEHRRDVSRHS